MLHLIYNTINYCLLPTSLVCVFRTIPFTSNPRPKRSNIEDLSLGQCGAGAIGNQRLRDENKGHVIAPMLPNWGGGRGRVADIDDI